MRGLSGSDPRPRTHHPTLLLDTNTGLLSYDADGTGPISDEVIVELQLDHGFSRNWIEFTP
jgi:hypothetical protein